MIVHTVYVLLVSISTLLHTYDIIAMLIELLFYDGCSTIDLKPRDVLRVRVQCANIGCASLDCIALLGTITRPSMFANLEDTATPLIASLLIVCDLGYRRSECDSRRFSV